MTTDAGVGRRLLLAAAGAVTVAAAVTGSAGPPPAATTGPVSAARARQTGVLAPAQPATVLVTYDVTVRTRAELAAILRGWRVPAGVHMTVSVGASLFDARFDLAPPRQLVAMPAFAGDVLDPQWCHGDLLVQFSAQLPDALPPPAPPGLRQRWRIDGFHPTGLGPGVRNLFGFREGAGNPDTTDADLMNQLVWVQPADGEPPWCTGGSYHVVRLIRLALPIWDAEPQPEQERVFGRYKDTGAPLGHTSEHDIPDYTADPTGLVIPLDAHIRRANPGTTQSRAHRILRRGYAYHRPADPAGQTDAGHIFGCYQRDLERGFVTIQHRLRGEALQRYLLTFGGGYYFLLPGAQPANHDYLGRTLLEE